MGVAVRVTHNRRRWETVCRSPPWDRWLGLTPGLVPEELSRRCGVSKGGPWAPPTHRPRPPPAVHQDPDLYRFVLRSPGCIGRRRARRHGRPRSRRLALRRAVRNRDAPGGGIDVRYFKGRSRLVTWLRAGWGARLSTAAGRPPSRAAARRAGEAVRWKAPRRRGGSADCPIPFPCGAAPRSYRAAGRC